MFRLLVVLSICLTAGCSSYDVTRLAADAAFAMITTPIDNALDSAKEKAVPIAPEYRDDDDYEHVFWDEDVSRCIPIEREVRELDRLFDAVEEGRDYVMLPNGERYPLNRREHLRGDELTVTQECIARHDD